MANRNLVVIGSSAGGIEALRELVSLLPRHLDAAVLIAQHTSSHAGSLIPLILGRVGKLPVVHPEDGTEIVKGRVYVAPPDFHMIVEGNILRVVQGPRENLHRPAIDPLFRSAAASYGRAVIGVILTGLLDDGTSGLMAVRAAGGEAIIQDPKTASFPAMPMSAFEQVPDAHILPVHEIAPMLVRLIRQELPEKVVPDIRQTTDAERESRISELNMAEIENEERIGRPSAFGCPDCGGVLWEIEEGEFLRFRCRVGHAYTAHHLAAEQRRAVETALWAGLRALEERSSLYRRIANRAGDAKQDLAANSFYERAANTETNAHVLRDFLLQVNRHEGTFNSPSNEPGISEKDIPSMETG